MKIIKKEGYSVKVESAHNGASTRKLFVDNDEVKNVQGITVTWLKPGDKNDWHNHADCNECMFIVKGKGVVADEDGEYEFKAGDFFIFPKGVYHSQHNTGRSVMEAVFIRTK